MGMRLRDTDQASEPAFGKFTVMDPVRDISEQPRLRVAKIQFGDSSYFEVK